MHFLSDTLIQERQMIHFCVAGEDMFLFCFVKDF